MLRTKLHILANTRNRRSITVCSQLILARGIRRTLNFRLDPRHLSNSGKSDVPKPEPESEASTSKSELQSTANDPRENNTPNLETANPPQPQNSDARSLTSTQKQSIKVDLNNVESKNFQPVKIEHDIAPSTTISASSIADESSEISGETVKEGTAVYIELSEIMKFATNLNISPPIIYLLQKQRRRNSRKI
jgi:hypothetical protein